MTKSELRLTPKHYYQVDRDVVKGKMNEYLYIILREQSSGIGWESQVPNDRENGKCECHINRQGF
jgi:hypothetical protein